MMLHDVNVRVGVLKLSDNPWCGVIRKQGLDERDMVGEEFLQLRAVN